MTLKSKQNIHIQKQLHHFPNLLSQLPFLKLFSLKCKELVSVYIDLLAVVMPKVWVE